jgi:hypothetical protein
MSLDYTIKIKLDALYSEENILKILKRGASKGFIYYDQITLEQYLNVPVVSPKQAAGKIINAYKAKLEPSVYASLGDIFSIHFWFYETDDEWLEFHISGAGIIKKNFYIDFAYYIRFYLDLCDDFCVLELKTETF